MPVRTFTKPLFLASMRRFRRSFLWIVIPDFSIYMFVVLFIKMSIVYQKLCLASRGTAGLFDSLVKSIIEMSIAGLAPISAPCRAHSHAAFRRVAGGALVEKEAA